MERDSNGYVQSQQNSDKRLRTDGPVSVKMENISPPCSPTSITSDKIILDYEVCEPEVKPEPAPPSPEYILSDVYEPDISIIKQEQDLDMDTDSNFSQTMSASPKKRNNKDYPSSSKNQESLILPVSVSSVSTNPTSTSVNTPRPILKKPFKCMKCLKCFSTERHLRSHNCDPDSLECDVCGEKMISKDQLKEHQATVQCGVCKDCGKEFSDAPAFKAHRLLSHAEGASYKCSLCKISFNRVFSLTNHIKKAHSKKTFDCDICGKIMTDEESLKTHQTENSCAKCFDCGKIFAELSAFRAHRLIAHVENAPHKCCICKTTFTKLSNLTNHIRKAHSQKNHQCSICGNGFPDEESLKEHELANSCGKCHDCGKEYISMSALKAHRLLAHPDGASHKCPMCKMSFEKPNGLTWHIRRVHNEINPYICSTCGHKSANRQSLNLHMKTHKRKPHACSECELNFTSKAALANHKRSVHEDENIQEDEEVLPFKCQQCEKSFSHASFLNDHTISVHAPKANTQRNSRLRGIKNEPSE